MQKAVGANELLVTIQDLLLIKPFALENKKPCKAFMAELTDFKHTKRNSKKIMGLKKLQVSPVRLLHLECLNSSPLLALKQ